MMRSEIDKFFTRKHDFLLTIAKGLCAKRNRQYDAEIALTDAYLEVIKNPAIQDLDQLQRYTIATMSLQITASNSRLNYQDYLTKKTDLTDFVNSKLSVTDEHNECIIDAYRSQLRDTQKKIILEAYIDKKHSSNKKLARYFNLSPTTIHFLMKEIKEDIKNFSNFERKKHETV